MKILPTLVVLLVSLSFSLALARAGEKSDGDTGSTEGTFVGIDQGDYTHFLIKNKKGEEESFIALRPDDSVKAFLDSPAGLRGRSIRVYWKMETISEAGGKEKTVTKVEERKPLDH